MQSRNCKASKHRNVHPKVRKHQSTNTRKYKGEKYEKNYKSIKIRKHRKTQKSISRRVISRASGACGAATPAPSALSVSAWVTLGAGGSATVGDSDFGHNEEPCGRHGSWDVREVAWRSAHAVWRNLPTKCSAKQGHRCENTSVIEGTVLP